eukprot:TRINITY_DN9404_c0_g1_i5.p1 TRINITY_DN9404_c0_g1~~TRINITY_DN9404_c0_g1_i5.p1  ORF type:complete len:179 (+),score=22.06 TRINITY_DN9404_c0_g1_i5:524-1060(+)
MAEYAKKNLHVYIEEELAALANSKAALADEDYRAAIENAFDRIEAEFMSFSKEALQKGFSNAASVGACALVTIVSGDKLYVASAGDCKAGTLFEQFLVLIREADEEFEGVKIGKRFNLGKKSEQKRLSEKFPNEDIMHVHYSLTDRRGFCCPRGHWETTTCSFPRTGCFRAVRAGSPS